jgi:RNA polymerase sigma-70 factor, ECF subfamily
MTAPEPTDAALARAAANGDLAAFERLVHRHQQGLYRQAVGYLGSRADAEDSVQEVFCRAFERLPSLRELEKLGPWLRALLRNHCLNSLRARQRRAVAEGQADSGWVDTTPPPAVLADGGASELLHELPGISAEAVRLHYLEGRSIREVAEALGTTPGSVKQRLYRARHQLKKEAIAMATTRADRVSDDFSARVIVHLIESGRQDRLHMRYPQAQAHFYQVLDMETDHPEALLELGRTYDPLGWPDDEQFSVLERAARARPDSLEVACELATACRMPGRQQRLPEVKEHALALSQRRLADRPDDIVALKTQARLLTGDGNHSDAEQLLRSVLEVCPDDPEARFWLARALDRMDRRAEAQPLYERICEDAEGTYWAYLAHRNRATHLAFRDGDIQRAVEHMEEVWRITGKANEAGNLIYFLGACERFDRVLQLYEHTWQDQRHSRVHATAGIAYSASGRPEPAKAAWERAIAGTEQTAVKAEASLHLARTLFDLGQPDLASECIDAGLKLDLSERRTLAQDPTTPFWIVWSRWLVGTLEALLADGARLSAGAAPVAVLLEEVRGEAGE